MHHDHPELVRDQYWDEVFPQELPYTLAAEPFREQHPLPSTANIAVKDTDAEVLLPPSGTDDFSSAINFTARPSNLRRAGSSRTSMGRSVPGKIKH